MDVHELLASRPAFHLDERRIRRAGIRAIPRKAARAVTMVRCDGLAALAARRRRMTDAAAKV
jgi:hypothetical protein